MSLTLERVSTATEIADDIAVDFINDPRIIIDFDDKSKNKKKEVKGSEEKEVIIAPKVLAPKKKSIKALKKEMKDLNKDVQIEKLLNFGLTNKEIKALHYERQRVDKLVELMS